MQRFWPTCHQSCRAKIWPHTACRVLFRFCFSFLSPWFLMGSGHKPLPGRAQTYCGKGYLVIWTELCFRQIHMLKPSSLVLQNVTVFGDKWGHQAGPSRNMTGVLMKRGTWMYRDTGVPPQSTDHESTQRGQPCASREENPQNETILILDFGPSVLCGDTFLMFKPPTLRRFVTAVLASRLL